MTKTDRKAIKKYLRDIKKVLICLPAEKRKTMNMISEGLDSYISEHPSADSAEVIKNFGSPYEIAAEYSGFDCTDLVCRAKKRNKKIVIAVIVILFAALTVFSFIASVAACVAIEQRGAYSIVYIEQN